MTRKTLACILVVCILGWLGYKVHRTFNPLGKENSRVYSVESKYTVDEEIKNALAGFDAAKPVEVITQGPDATKGIILSLDGMADKETMNKIMELLEKHKAKGTFFIQGAYAAEHKEIVEDIVKKGYGVENYTLSGKNHMEKLGKEEIIGDFARSQKVFTTIMDKPPTLLKCQDTEYTDTLLKAARATGFKAVVRNAVVLRPLNFDTLDNANAFVVKIPKGSIVSIKLNRYSKTKDEKIKVVDIGVFVENFLQACENNNILVEKI